MSDFGDTSGVDSDRGYYYQKLVALYYLIVEEAREIEYESDGEDLAIVNENPNRNSIEYIQVKFLSYGSFSLANFKNDVFPQLWTAFDGAMSIHSEKAIRTRLVTNVAWNREMKIFVDLCRKYRDRGLLFSQFERSMKPIKRDYDSLKSGKDFERFQRFIWGFDIHHGYSLKYFKDSIISYMHKCGIRGAKEKLNSLIGQFSEIGQGPITRRQIEDSLGHNLNPIKNSSEEDKTPSVSITQILSDLENAKKKYGVNEQTYPDKDSAYKDMSSPVKRANRVIKYSIEHKNTSSTTSSIELEELSYMVESDTEKALESAQTIVSLEEKLWLEKVSYKRRITSMQETAKQFGIDLEEDSS